MEKRLGSRGGQYLVGNALRYAVLRQFASTLTNVERRLVSRYGQYLVGNALR
jgi:hypothetical protein